MVGKARVEHVAHLRLLLEPRRKRQGVLLVALHAHGQRLDATAHEPGRERVKPRADRLDEVTQPLGDLGHGRDEQARDDVVVAGEVLGGAVDHHVGAKRDGVHEEGREEGVVHHEQGARAVGQLGQGADVGDRHERVGGTLHEERLGARLESGRDRVEVRRVNAVDLHAVFGTYRVEQANRATIEVPRGHEPVARREELHETGDGGHAGGERETVVAALELAHRVLEHLARGVLQARVVIARALAHTGVRKRRGEVERRHDGARRVLDATRRMDARGREVHAKLPPKDASARWDGHGARGVFYAT